MSGRATGWVLRHGPTPDMTDRDGRPYGQRARGLRFVLVAVADAANADGEHAHPGIDNVASGALYSKRQAVTLLAQLVDEGWLRVVEHGGGRKRATEYALPLMGQSVRSLHSIDDRICAVTAQNDDEKLCSGEPETVQSARETVQSRLHSNGLTTVKNNGKDSAAAPQRATDDPLTRHAHALAVVAFEQPSKPVLREGGKGAFVAVMAIFERLLRGGTSVQHLRAAIEGGFVSVWTVAGVQTAVAHARGRPRAAPGAAAVAATASAAGVDPAQVQADADSLFAAPAREVVDVSSREGMV